MTALLNIRVDIIRMDYNTDEVGGAVETGTVVYKNISARQDFYTPKWTSQPAGIETAKTYTFIIRPPSMIIFPEDVIQIVFPSNHNDFMKRFRIRGVQYQSIHPSDHRGFIDCTCTRIEFSRSNVTN